MVVVVVVVVVAAAGKVGRRRFGRRGDGGVGGELKRASQQVSGSWIATCKVGSAAVALRQVQVGSST